MSRAGGAPNKRPCSRLNCEGFSYPILKPAVAASNFGHQEATSFLKAKLLLVLQRTHGGNRLEPKMKPRGGDWDVRALKDVPIARLSACRRGRWHCTCGSTRRPRRFRFAWRWAGGKMVRSCGWRSAAWVAFFAKLESDAAWRARLDDLINRGLKTPERVS